MTMNTDQTTLQAGNYSARYAKGHVGHIWLQVDLFSAFHSQASLRGIRGEFSPRQTRQLPRAVDLKGRLLSCQSY